MTLCWHSSQVYSLGNCAMTFLLRLTNGPGALIIIFLKNKALTIKYVRCGAVS
jgi:hypothetical protein